jgi:hypothetical protein
MFHDHLPLSCTTAIIIAAARRTAVSDWRNSLSALDPTRERGAQHGQYLPVCASDV